MRRFRDRSRISASRSCPVSKTLVDGLPAVQFERDGCRRMGVIPCCTDFFPSPLPRGRLCAHVTSAGTVPKRELAVRRLGSEVTRGTKGPARWRVIVPPPRPSVQHRCDFLTKLSGARHPPAF